MNAQQAIWDAFTEANHSLYGIEPPERPLNPPEKADVSDADIQQKIDDMDDDGYCDIADALLDSGSLLDVMKTAQYDPCEAGRQLQALIWDEVAG